MRPPRTGSAFEEAIPEARGSRQRLRRLGSYDIRTSQTCCPLRSPGRNIRTREAPKGSDTESLDISEANGFGVGAGGWISPERLFRDVLGDVKGDGLSDIVGFASDGTYVSFATGGGK